MRFCSLQSGSSGNCQFIEYKDTRILVDCGLNGKKTKMRLEEIGVDIDSIDAILITHEHSDHVCGAGVIARRHNIPIFAREKTLEGAVPTIKNCGEGLNICHKDEFRIKDLLINAYNVSHDANDPVCYTIIGDKKISIITDTGYVTREALYGTKNSDLYYIESNHDYNMLMNGPYPYLLKMRVSSEIGHLSNEDAAYYLVEQLENRGEIAVLGHLSFFNNTEEIALNTVRSILDENGKTCELKLSYRDRIGEVIEL